MTSDQRWMCAICGGETEGFGNNPAPVLSHEDRVCDDCNMRVVIPARLGATIKVKTFWGQEIQYPRPAGTEAR